MKKIIFLFVFIISMVTYPQEGLLFSRQQQLYLKGNSALIGNNIVSTDATKPLNDLSGFNDNLKLEYIDIDDDKTTFSSSQANLTIDVPPSKIKYAALYWSAVYKYDKGVKRELKEKNKIVYKGNDTRSMNVNSILFKQPNGNYQKIEGQIIFDSYNSKLFEFNKPYLCYADVTSQLQQAKTINGSYTVANILATEGYISGGASGGWLLYIVYESEKAKPKYFATFKGFVEVYKEPVDIIFNNFKTDESDTIKSSFCLGALEGDQKLKTDSCLILDSNQDFVPFYNKLRPPNNFFNGKITIYDESYSDRVPNSLNTLGFDLLKMDIPNENNQIISNNTTQTIIRFETRADRFYLFFVAFETEISPIYLEGKNNVDSILVLEKNKAIPEETSLSNQVIDTIPNEKDVLEQKNTVEKIKRLKSISIPSIPKGYYLVTNVFASKNNTMKWMQELEEKGYQPKSYTNPKNGWHYIYLLNDEDPNTIYQKHKELSKLEDFQDIWILKLNF